MTLSEFTSAATRTECNYGHAIVRLHNNPISLLRLLHSALGMQNEIGEIVKQLKAHLFYGKEIDPINLQEEYGDLAWFWAIGVDELTRDPGEILRLNIEKLKVRYPEKFDSELAINRKLDSERAVLEGK